MSKNILAYALFAGFLLLAAPALPAQKTTDLKRAGEKQFANRQWAESLTTLGQYQQEKPGDLGVLTKLGICNYHLHQAEKARQYLEFVLQKNPTGTDPDVHYYLARTLHGLSEFERAIGAYKGFLRVAGDKHPLRANALDNIRRCVGGLGIRPNPDVALVENLGDRVNTPGDEFAPLPSVNFPNRVYFSAARENCTGGRRNAEGYEDLETGQWCSDMFFSNRTNSGWNYATLLGDLLNTPRYEVVLDFSSDGQVLYFFRGFTLFSGEILADTAGRNAVSSPAFSSPMLPEEGDTAPFLATDSLLLFASRRPGGQGGLDLYYAMRTDSGWTQPLNLGLDINSPYDETTPFLARDGRTLYFSSNSTRSMGGLDIFKSVFDPATQTWSEPVNLGTPVNSPGDDAFFRLTADGLSAFFSSDRLDSYGQRDIFMVYFKQEQMEQYTRRTLFAAAAKKTGNAATPGAVAAKLPESANFPVLYYNTDNDILNEENRKSLSETARLAQLFPEAKVLVCVHTNETGPAKFDLYYGIKRAEIVGKALTDLGVPARNISLKSFGSAYPVARNVLNALPNPTGQRLNRRIEIWLASAEEPLPLTQTVQRQIVPQEMAIGGIMPTETRFKGLTYKVEAVAARQVVTNDALAMYADLMIESEPESGSYRYSTGYFRAFAEAAAHRRELQAQGFSDALVTAYVDGVRVSRADAAGLVKKYPDLAAFIKN
ncbi:MAG: PD40 domain-containing protein [Saprospiraceae bacterium]|jgi:outer membrane protein OmpA-like peptidoglycan-associated protein/tetratricopeptide (TPR) repeat protein|nr:PD40 domain-containing protein [Saprospiraceae bacterium]